MDDSPGMSRDPFIVLGVGSGKRTASKLANELDVSETAVLPVPDAERARETIRTTRIDCVVSAQSLPDDTGVALLRTLRSTHPELPFVLVGDRIDESVARAAVDAGVTDYVSADCHPGQLRMIARRVESAASERTVSDPSARMALTVQSALAELPVVVSVCDASGRIQSVEGAGVPVVDAGDLVDNPVEDVFDTHPDLVESCERALNGKRVETTVDVDDRVFETVHTPLRQDGRVVGAAMVALDVTDRVERERELAETEHVLRTVFENARDAILVIDPGEDAIRRANPAACDLLEYDRDELIGTSPEAIHPDEIDRFREFVGTVLDEGEGWTDELECLTRSETVIPAEISASSIVIDGRPHVLAVVRDVTERKVYEHRLEALNELGRELATVHDPGTIAKRVVSVAEGVLELPLTAIWRYEPTDERLVPLAATDPATEFPEENSGSPAVPALPEGSFEMGVFEAGEPRAVENYAAVENPGHPEAPLGTVLMIPIGDHGLLNVGSPEVAPFADSERNLIEILARIAETSLDRAERRRKLERKNERLAEFASVVSHDLRNPLEVAEGYLEQARKRERMEYLDEVEAALEHMEQLIDDVLTLAREGESVSEFESVDLAALAREAWSLTAGDDTELVVDPGLGTVACDPDRLRQLLGNLFSNAVEHGTREAGNGEKQDAPTVSVGALPDGFYVADDGPGIPPDDREDVFESGVTETDDGTGHGLAIVRRIAEAHGWSIRVTESENGGARFEVTEVRMR